MPYLIDKLLGETTAVVIAGICTAVGIGFLIAGAIHRHGARRYEGQTNWRMPVYAVVLLCGVASMTWWIMTHSDIDTIVVGSATGAIEEFQPSGGVQLNVDLINNGRPSITKNWKGAIRLPNGEVFQGQELKTWISAYLEGNNKNPWHEWHIGDFIDYKTATMPIPSGGRVRGIIAFAFIGIPRERINELGTEVILTFEDSRSRKSTTRYTIPTKVDYFARPPL